MFTIMLSTISKAILGGQQYNNDTKLKRKEKKKIKNKRERKL